MDKKAFTKFLKHQSYVIYISLLVIVLGTITVSSAIFTTEKYSNKEQVVESGTFVINYTQGSLIEENVFLLPYRAENNGYLIASGADKGAEDLRSKEYEFTVQNNGSIEASYKIQLQRAAGSVAPGYIRYSLDGNAPRTLISGNTNTASVTTTTIEVYTLKNNETKTHKLRVWLSDDTPLSNIWNTNAGKVDLSIIVQAVPNDPSIGDGQYFAYTGTEQTFIAPYTGTYTITAAGAEGTLGSNYCVTEDKFNSYNIRPGKGAKIQGDFYLNAGDELAIIVGGVGQITDNSVKDNCDGVTGAGGGGSFIFKKISEIADERFQFTKSNINYDILLVAAGGGGTVDLSHEWREGDLINSSATINGNAINYFSPTHYSAFSTDFCTEDCNVYVLGINQYIYNNLLGGEYSFNDSSTCNGGYGGGTCGDDGEDRASGGGWNYTNNSSYSWSQGSNTQGFDGAQEGNGFVSIKYKDSN